MNRKLLALAIGAAVSLPVAANAAPTLYGLMNLSVDRTVDTARDGLVSSGNEYLVNSNSSRLGFMGEENLGNGLSAVYKIEEGVSGNGTVGWDFTTRDRFVGLKGDFGTVKLGSYDSPLKQARGMVDQFYDMTYTDVGNLIYGQTRLESVIGYDSPVFADALSFKLALQPGERQTTPSGTVKNGLADGMSASATYDANNAYLALGYDHDISENNNYDTSFYSGTTGRNTLRLVGGYTLNALQLGALLQSSKVAHDNGAVPSNKDDQKSVLLSAAYSLDEKNVIKGQLVRSQDTYDDAAAVTKVTKNFIGLGYDHNFTKMTKAYAQVAEVRTTEKPDGKETFEVFTVGMQTKF